MKKTAVCVTTHIGRESFLSRKNAKRAKDTKIIFFEIISGNFFQKEKALLFHAEIAEIRRKTKTLAHNKPRRGGRF